MDLRSSISSSRSIDLPKPETGLAEWTSKIKAMQRQVDADDEAEQRKLEEEIAASRIARMRRRSQGAGSKTSSDLSLEPEYVGAITSYTSGNRSTDDLKPSIKRQTDQEEALRKLMGSRGISSPAHSVQEQKSISSLAQSQPKPDHMSLAAFMGGRATGPRLNRHAPQQDAHDPTQFDQRTWADAPHPVFGRGGIAMPGMTAKGRTSTVPESAIQNRDVSDRSRSASPTPHNNGISSAAPDTARTQTEDQPVASSHKPNIGYEGRERGPIYSESSRAKSPYLQPKKTPGSVGPDTYESSGRLERLTEKRNSASHSPSPATSVYSQRKTPDPSPSTHKPRPVSRDYDLPDNTYRSPSLSPAHEQSTKKQDAVSLAAFMGGNATGPRLNRHAPQQDVHDPTQFEQRRNLSAPHPVFGKGGIAMPGMTAKETSSAKFRNSGQLRDAIDRSQSTGRSEDQLSTCLSTGLGLGTRERAISTPSRGSGYSPPPRQGDYIDRPIARSSISDTRVQTPTSAINTLASSPPDTSPPYPPRQSNASTPPVSPSLLKTSTVTTPSLARPIQPVPRQSPTGPYIPPTKNPSRAFLRPPAEKEPTPSLSRLKGRGFVQSMIKTSTQLEASANEFGGNPSSDKARSVPRKSSVLDRWQPATSTSVKPASPPISPKPIPIGKSRTMDQSSSSSDVTFGSISPRKSPHQPVDASRSLKTVASHPSMLPADPPRPSSRASSKRTHVHDDISQATPGLGSSSTLISYIKPTKTGDDPLPEVRTSMEKVNGKKSSTSELPVASGQSLKHPTKGRAKKPRKDRDAKQVHNQGLSGNSVSKTDFHGDSWLPVSTAAVRTESRLTPSTSITLGVAPNGRHTNGNVEQMHANQSSDNSVVPAGHVANRRTNQAIIGVKYTSAGSHVEAKSDPAKSDPNGLLGRQALPGLTTSATSPPTLAHKQEDKPDRSPSTPLSPGRHTRIPSTGNRATVMNVAQVWSEQHVGSPSSLPNSISASVQHTDIRDESPEMIEKLAEAIPKPRNITQPNVQAEKRKSGYEKYSGVIMPPLPEENTPVPSPVGTLSQSTTQAQVEQRSMGKIGRQESPEVQLMPNLAGTAEVGSPVDAELVHIDYLDEPLPKINITALLNTEAHKFMPNPYESTISTDVMRIAKSTANSISKDTHVFYDTEVLAIIQRSKSISSGLVSTKVWSWQGKRSQYGEKEERKLQELAQRYGTILNAVHQYQEPPELVHLLGGTLAIRQGIRAHWSSENTAMHSVRLCNGSIFIEEHDLSITNMCSGFSYCLTILDTLYVWHGCGSRQQERDAALKYAQGLAAKGSTVVELIEDESDDDEMFWMILGDDEYAKADYWKWRRTAPEISPRLWRIDSNKGKDACQFIASISKATGVHDSVYVIDCVWEYFVLVGEKARGRRPDIRLAMSVAQQLSSRVASSRPFGPTIHAIILPSRLPLDLRLQLRGLDEAQLNNEMIPDHMNILSSAESLEHLQRRSWNKTALKNYTLLPLGLDPSAIP